MPTGACIGLLIDYLPHWTGAWLLLSPTTTKQREQPAQKEQPPLHTIEPPPFTLKKFGKRNRPRPEETPTGIYFFNAETTVLNWIGGGVVLT